MIVELNIGLPPGATATDIAAAGYRIGELSTNVLSRTQEVSYKGHNGPVHERVLIVRAWLRGEVLRDETLDELAFAYCRAFQQECIAVCLPDLTIGTLIGPKAAEWGAFDIDKFVPYVVAEKQQEQKKKD